jgi:acyltransferase
MKNLITPPEIIIMRLNYLDNMKAIGIFFVVLGHSAWLNPKLFQFIYSFHMPLFFVISGFLISSKNFSLTHKLT